MRTTLFRIAGIACAAVGVCPLAPAQVPAAGTLRAGAAAVSITPAPDAALPMSGYAGRTEGFKGIHDDLHVRAISQDRRRPEDGILQPYLRRQTQRERNKPAALRSG